MNIALVESHAVPGAWKYDLALATELMKLDNQVTILTSKAFPPINGTFGGSILKDFPDLRAHSSPIAKGIHYLVGTGATLKRLWTGEFDVIHWQFFNVFPPAETLMAKMLFSLRERLVLTVHDVTPWSAVKGKSNFLLRATYQTAKRIIVHHEVNRNELATTFRLPRERIRVVPHGSFTHFSTGGLDRTQSRTMLGLPEEAPLILFFGEIRPEKGLIYLIRALKTILAHVPHARLVIAGRPRHMDMSECLSTIRDLGLQESVILRLEHIKDEHVEAYFCMADVVALPYVAITQSGVLFEAMTAGRPVVVTDVGAIGPTVREAKVGHVVPPGQVEPLASAILDLLGNSDRAQQMGQNGRRAALDTYSWARCAQATLTVYREL